MAKKLQSSKLHPGPGFRIRKNISRPTPELIEKFREFETPDISDLMNRLYISQGAGVIPTLVK